MPSVRHATWIAVMTAALGWTSWGGGQPPDELASKMDRPPAPAAAVPKPAAAARQNVPDFMFEHNTFHLAEGRFDLLFYDYPKAVLAKCPAQYLADDTDYFYCLDQRFGHEWAFGKAPAGNFAGHAVWSRKSGATTWDLRTRDATMATPSPLPGPPAK